MDDERLVRLLDEISCYEQGGDFKKLLPPTNEYIKLASKIYGVKSIKYTSALKELAAVHMDIGNYQKSEEIFFKCTDALVKIRGKDDPEYASAICAMAELYSRTQRSQQAEKLFSETVRIYTISHGESNIQTIKAINRFGQFYLDESRFNEAEGQFLKSKGLLEKRGDDLLEYAATLSNLASVYQNTDRAAESAVLFSKVLDIYKENLGSAHPLCATAYNNLAMSLYKTGNTKEAVKCFYLAEEIIRKNFGMRSSYHKMALRNLGFVHEAIGEADKAAFFFREAEKDEGA